MDKELVVEIIKEKNKWWNGNFKVNFKTREVYEEIKKFLHTKQIVSFTGLRRVGKTTMMFKIVEDMQNNFDKENIFYFSFDEFKDFRIREIINLYEELKNKDINNGKYLFLFDEIQKIKGWEEQLKSIYDSYSNVKFIISGSESLFIRKGIIESLAGRIFEFKISPLNFKEFLRFREKNFDNLLLHREEILKEFKRFLLANGFPEIINENEEIIEKYIQENVIEKIIYRDLAEIVEIKNTPALNSVFNIIYNNPGQIIELNELSNELGISRQTISTYLDYLEKAFLIKKVYNFSRNIRKTERRLKKYYPTIINQYLIKNDFSKVFETSMVMQLGAEYFWRDSSKNEVDVILIKNLKDKKIVPIEIKSSRIKPKHLKPIYKFMKEFKIKNALILSYDEKKEFRSIKAIPFYEYLLNKSTKKEAKKER
jgi:hypothetical protein